MLGFELVMQLVEQHIIEVVPLAYMRGRTLNDAFIILDEAQNTTKEQMKMFLTRIGFNSKVVVSGDTTQTDLPRGIESGLCHCLSILKNITFNAHLLFLSFFSFFFFLFFFFIFFFCSTKFIKSNRVV